MGGADDRLGKHLFEGRFSVGACLCGLILAMGAYLNSQGGGSDAGSPDRDSDPRWLRDAFLSDRLLFCFGASASATDGALACPALTLRRDALANGGRRRLPQDKEDWGSVRGKRDWREEGRPQPGSRFDFGTGY